MRSLVYCFLLSVGYCGAELCERAVAACCALALWVVVSEAALFRKMVALLLLSCFLGLERLSLSAAQLGALRWLLFTALALVYALDDGAKRNDDPRVSFAAYEREIRQSLLAVNESGKLHLVDAWLRDYRGREEELLRRVRTRDFASRDFASRKPPHRVSPEYSPEDNNNPFPPSISPSPEPPEDYFSRRPRGNNKRRPPLSVDTAAEGIRRLSL